MQVSTKKLEMMFVDADPSMSRVTSTLPYYILGKIDTEILGVSFAGYCSILDQPTYM